MRKTEHIHQAQLSETIRVFYSHTILTPVCHQMAWLGMNFSWKVGKPEVLHVHEGPERQEKEEKKAQLTAGFKRGTFSVRSPMSYRLSYHHGPKLYVLKSHNSQECENFQSPLSQKISKMLIRFDLNCRLQNFKNFGLLAFMKFVPAGSKS